MDAIEFADKIGGIYLANKVEVVIDGRLEVAAYFDGPQLVITDAGRKAMNRASAEVAEPKVVTRTRKPKVLAEPTPVALPEIELSDIQVSDE